MALQPQQIQLSDEQKRLLDQQLFGDIPQAPQINNDVQQIIDNQRARDLQTQQMQSYFQPRDYQKPQNFREGAANVFQQVLLNPIKESLGLRDSPEDTYTRYKTAEAQAGLQLAQEQRLRQMQARQVASGMVKNLPQEDQTAFVLAELTDPGSGLQALKDLRPQDAQEFAYFNSLNPDEQAAYLDFKGASAGRTTINNTENIYKRLEAESYFENRQRVYDAARQARNTNYDITQMEELLQGGVPTGFGSEFLLNVRRAAQAFGFGDDEGIMDAQIAGSEAYIGLSNRIVLPQVKQLGVNPTDKDLGFIVAGSPDLAKSLAGNLLMLEALRFSNDRAIMMGDAQARFEEENIDLLSTNPAGYAAKLRIHMMGVQNSPEFAKRRLALRAAKNRILGGDNFAEDDAAIKMYNALGEQESKR